jgi:CHASE3 domain sensor protein
MPVQTKSVAAFGLAFILLTGASFTSCVALLKFKRSSQWVNHTNQVLAQTEMVFSEVKDAETGQRGYLLTRKSRYLQPYYSAVYRTPENLQTLRQLTSDNLNQQKRIQQLQLLIDAKFAELKQTIDLDRTQGVAAALAVVQTDEGQFLMDQIRELVRSIEVEETTLLHQRIEQANQDANAAIASVVLLSLLTIGLAGGAVRRMVYYIATLEQMGARLQSFNDELDQQVQARTQALLSSNAALQAEIQERQQIEAALRESEQQFRSTFNQAAVGIAHVSPEGNWLQVNERLCEIVGYSREELLQKTFQDITYPMISTLTWIMCSKC